MVKYDIHSAYHHISIGKLRRICQEGQTIYFKCLALIDVDIKVFFKLKSAGVSGSLLTWFSDYLDDRKQRVFFLPVASLSQASVKV